MEGWKLSAGAGWHTLYTAAPEPDVELQAAFFSFARGRQRKGAKSAKALLVIVLHLEGTLFSINQPFPGARHRERHQQFL